MRTTQLSVTWERCSGPPPVWCSLLRVNLDDPYFDGLGGVYVIWYGGADPRAVRVGQGAIRDRLQAHRRDPAIRVYQWRGLYVTWAQVAAAYRDGVERYLADQLRPVLGQKYPDAAPIPVNLPGQ